MKYQGEELVRVRSESELRPGMLVVSMGCKTCGGSHSSMLLAKHKSPMCSTHGVGNCETWNNHPRYHRAEGSWWCVARHVREGRLYRLRDEAPAEQQTTATKRRERV